MEDSPHPDHTFFATCPRNAEDLLLRELEDLGAEEATETRGGIRFSGTLALAYRACLWSRVANRILLRLTSFPIETVDDIYGAIRELDWEKHLATRGTLAVEVTTTVARGPLAHLNTHFAEQRVKDAVVDRFRAKYGERPGVDLSRPDVRINVHIDPVEAVVSLDLSGDGLHRRGYRLEGGGAPLKENLAAAILLRAGWPQMAAADRALLDPMCGSGTLLIEGALMAADIAPGIQRDYFGFLGWKGHQPDLWAELVKEAQERRGKGLKSLPPVIGYDLDKKAMGTARANARRAGLAGRVIFERRGLDVLSLPSGVPSGGGLVVTNPPYGKRLGDQESLIPTYETLGAKLKESFSGWDAAVFTGNASLSEHLGLRAHRVNTFYNGPLECRFLLFHIGQVADARRQRDDAKQQREPSPSGNPPGSGVEMLANRLRKNQKRLRSWLARENIRCYRIYDSDLSEYAFAIDVYEDRVHVQEYAPPPTVDPVRARRRAKEALATIPDALGVPPDHVVLKIRKRQKGTDQYQRLDDQSRFFEVAEGGLRFLVNLTDYLDTGLFLDHRITRGLIRDAAKGARFLNLFAYTGSATVYAAAGGATSTTTMDLSSTYLDWAQRNLRLNGFSGPEHCFLRTDCVEWLTTGVGEPGAYDLIFMDVPTFSNSKSMVDTLDVQRDHAALIRNAVRLLAPGGKLLFSTNYKRFKLDAGLETEYEVRDLTKQTIPVDFSRDPRVHRCFSIVRPVPQSFNKT